MFVWNVDPVLLQLGSLEIRYYGVLFASSLMLAYFLARRLCQIRGLSLEKLDQLVLYVVIGLILGARFGHIVFYELDYYLAHPLQILKVWEGGLASHGATIGTLSAYLLFMWQENRGKTKDQRLGFFAFADVLVVVAGFPVSMVRLGNFFNSELIGRATDLPWAVVFERMDQVPRHPSQLYEFLMGLVLLGVMILSWRKWNKKVAPGFFFGLFFTLYFAMRFTVEFFKEFPLHESFFNLTTGQMLSLPFFVLGIVVLKKAWKNPSSGA